MAIKILLTSIKGQMFKWLTVPLFSKMQSFLSSEILHSFLVISKLGINAIAHVQVLHQFDSWVGWKNTSTNLIIFIKRNKRVYKMNSIFLGFIIGSVCIFEVSVGQVRRDDMVSHCLSFWSILCILFNQRNIAISF